MSISIVQSIIMAIIQGITELFPVSSVAHGVLTPYVFHWNLSPDFLNQHFLPFVVLLHLGTAAALLVFFRHEWIELIASIFDSSRRQSRKLLVMILVGSIPAGLIGLILEKQFNRLFSNVTSAAIFLIVNGFILFFGERMRSRGRRSIQDLTIGQATVVGIFQALALIPGFSRSGSSMVAGFRVGLTHEAAARFSMLLATPIILAAGLLEVPKLLHHGGHGVMGAALVGFVVSGLFAYLAVAFLLRWFKRHEITAMRPFAYYCWIVGALILISRII